MSTGITVDCDLRTHLLQADAGVLVAVLAQLTGDAGVVDRFAGRISHVPDPPEQLGVADDDVDRVFAVLSGHGLGGPDTWCSQIRSLLAVTGPAPALRGARYAR